MYLFIPAKTFIRKAYILCTFVCFSMCASTGFANSSNFGNTLGHEFDGEIGTRSLLPVRELSISDVDIVEGTGGSNSIGVTISVTNTDVPITVNVTTSNGTATAGEDYTKKTNESIGFSMGDLLTKDVFIAINTDNLVETDETFMVTLSDPVGADLGVSVATVTIENDDMATISISDVSQLESLGVMTFQVTLTNPVAADVSLNYVINPGTATALNNDYTNTMGILTIDSSEFSADIIIPIIDDNDFEDDEVFIVKLSGLSALPGVSFQDDEGQGTIINDDDAPAVPTLGQWGIIVLMISLLILGTMQIKSIKKSELY